MSHLPFKPCNQATTFHVSHASAIFDQGDMWQCNAVCPVGCEDPGDTFSSRVMWRHDGKLVSYMYLPGDKKRCGIDWDWPGAFGDNTWKEVRVFMQVNDMGALTAALRSLAFRTNLCCSTNTFRYCHSLVQIVHD